MKRLKGFTLVELLVVISIIALLMSILLPALSGVRRQAKAVVCASRIKQITTAAIMWAAKDDRGKLPMGGIQGRWSDSVLEYDHDSGWSIGIEEYFKIASGVSESVVGDFTVPMPTEAVERLVPKLHESTLAKLFTCPNLKKEEFEDPMPLPIYSDKKSHSLPYIHGWKSSNPTRWSVRLGYCYLAGFNTEKWPELPSWVGRPNYADTINDPADSVIMTDKNRWDVSPRTSASGVGYSLTHTKQGYTKVWGNDSDSEDPRETYPNAKVITGYLDGSVRIKRLKECKPRQMHCVRGRYLNYLFTFY